MDRSRPPTAAGFVGARCPPWLCGLATALALTMLSACGNTPVAGPPAASADALDSIDLSAAPPAPIEDAAPVPLIRSAGAPRRLLQRPVRRRAALAPAAVRAWLYTSLEAQAHLMKLGADPSSSLRVWENFLGAAQVPFARLSGAAALDQAPITGVLVLPSVVVLSDAEQQAIRRWRNRGGAVLSTWWSGAVDPRGSAPGDAFMREVLDVAVAGTTADEADDVFMVTHGASPAVHSLPSGQRVWLERIPSQLPLRLTQTTAAAHITSWSRQIDAQKPTTLIGYSERRMDSGAWSRSVTLGYAEQNWLRSDPKQLGAVAQDALGWLLRQPAAYAGAWPYPYASATVLAVQAAEPLSDTEVELGRSYRDMGGRATFYILGANVLESLPAIQALQAQGHEIAHYGDQFEGFTGQPSATQAQRLDALRDQLAQAKVSTPQPPSFAAPMDAYDANTQQLLKERGYDNYLSYMEVGDAALPVVGNKGPDGVAQTIVLPRTLIGPEGALAEWGEVDGMANFLQAWALTADMGGLAVVQLPSQALLTPAQLKQITDRLRTLSGTAWLASAREVAQWWRQRSRVHVALSPKPQGLVLAVSADGNAPLAGPPLSVWVNLPNPDSRLRLAPLQAGDPVPAIVSQDAARARLSVPLQHVGGPGWLLSFEPKVGR